MAFDPKRFYPKSDREILQEMKTEVSRLRILWTVLIGLVVLLFLASFIGCQTPKPRTLYKFDCDLLPGWDYCPNTNEADGKCCKQEVNE